MSLENRLVMATSRGLSVTCLLLLLSIAAGAQAQPATRARPPSAAAATSRPATPMVIEPRAMDLLKAASARLAATKSMSFTAVASYERTTRLGPQLPYTLR